MNEAEGIPTSYITSLISLSVWMWCVRSRVKKIKSNLKISRKPNQAVDHYRCRSILHLAHKNRFTDHLFLGEILIKNYSDIHRPEVRNTMNQAFNFNKQQHFLSL
ncbi:Cysteine-rich receptor-like protein kinase [Dirofilaria immitis]